MTFASRGITRKCLGCTRRDLKALWPDTVLLAAALNTPTIGGGLRLAPEARLDDGMLDLVMIEMLPKSEVLALIPRLFLTSQLKSKRAERMRANKIRFSVGSETSFQGDGELLGKTPVEIETLHQALRVLVP